MSTIALIPAAGIEQKIDHLTRQIEHLTQALETTAPGSTGAIWLPRRKLATRYGMSPRTANLYIASALSAGALRTFRPTDHSGATGHPLYHVQDFENYIRRHTQA